MTRKNGAPSLDLARLRLNDQTIFQLSSNLHVHICQSNICGTSAGAIATGEHCTLNGGGDVSKGLLRHCPADYRTAREQLVKQTRTFQVGQVYSCAAVFARRPENIAFDRVYHAIVPPARTSDRQLPPSWKEIMKKLYRNLFTSADGDGKSSLAVPLLGSGKAGATFDEAIEPLAAALQELQSIRRRTLRDVYIHVVDSDAYRKLLSTVGGCAARQSPGRQGQGEAVHRGPAAATSQTDAPTDSQSRPQSAHSYASSTSSTGSNISVYQHHRQNSQSEDDAPYTMESSPRGLALIIDNETFHHPRLENRTETQMDLKSLLTLFRNHLGFHVQVKRDCTLQIMKDELEKFAHQDMLKTVDSCVVIIMTHGSRGDIVFGVDGDIVGGVPRVGTYMSTSEIQSYFTSSNCPALRGKPKLFIIQACRGDMEDTIGGPRPFRAARDAALEDPTEVRHSPEEADMYLLSAAVENYVAYRGVFVQLLCKVFRENAEKKHIKDLATMVHREMGRQVIEGHILTISQERGTLQKEWFLNPPPPAAVGGSQQ